MPLLLSLRNHCHVPLDSGRRSLPHSAPTATWHVRLRITHDPNAENHPPQDTNHPAAPIPTLRTAPSHYLRDVLMRLAPVTWIH